MKTRISWVCDENQGSIDGNLIQFDRPKYAKICIIRFDPIDMRVDEWMMHQILDQMCWKTDRIVIGNPYLY